MINPVVCHTPSGVRCRPMPFAVCDDFEQVSQRLRGRSNKLRTLRAFASTSCLKSTDHENRVRTDCIPLVRKLHLSLFEGSL